MRIALMGAGALGTILGAYITKAGYDIDLIDPYEEHVNELNLHGAHVIGKVDFVQKVKAITPNQMKGNYDLFIYMAKQTFNDVAIPQMKAHMHEDSIICVCQNGIPEYAVAEAVGESRVVGAPIGWGATFVKPGCAELTSGSSTFSCSLGSLEGPINENVLMVKSILESMCEVEVSDNLLGMRWTKLLVNAAYSGLSTALGTTYGGILDDEVAMNLILKIGNECIDIVRKKEIKLEHFLGYDLYEAFNMGDKEENNKSISIMREIWGPHRALVASMAQDLLRGKKCEIDAINGVVCHAGEMCGVATPVNERVVKVVKAIQNGELKYSSENIKEFSDLL